MLKTVGGLTFSESPDADELQSNYPHLSEEEAVVLSTDINILTEEERNLAMSVIDKIKETRY